MGWSISGGQQVYVVMESDGNRMRRRFLPQSKTYIVESDAKIGVEYRGYKKVYPKWRSLWIFWDRVGYGIYTEWATIYVPKGTVAIEFGKID